MNDQIFHYPHEHLATRRSSSFFQEDWETHKENIQKTMTNARVLVIGGAGSIGGAFVSLISRFKLGCLHIQDISENGLVEIVRTLRGSRVSAISEIKTFAFDYGSALFELFLAIHQYDFVFNFAAVKHVRAERDLFSLSHLLGTNILKVDSVCKSLSRISPRSFFSISTDKAANPTSLMGASKRIMEKIVFSLPSSIHVTSTRFANVAFSQGSLLEGWIFRIQKKQPIAAPKATKRFFISHEEASQICLLSAFIADSHTLTIPGMNQHHEVFLEDVAEAFIQGQGYTPCYLDDEKEAISRCSELIRDGKWPLLRTVLDTTGEKPYEEFLGEDEKLQENNSFKNLLQVRSEGSISQKWIKELEQLFLSEGKLSRERIVEKIQELIPFLSPHHQEKSLDDRL